MALLLFESTPVLSQNRDEESPPASPQVQQPPGHSLQIHVTGDPSGIKPCPDVRIIFADLHLGAGTPSDHNADFSMLGGLLETTIKPVGPYLIVLWTRYSDQAPALREFLEDRLQDVEKPFDVLPLAKAAHLDDAGGIRNEDALMDAIVQITQSLPQVGALFDWESRVLEAAGDTLSSILKLASTQAKDKQADDIGKILASLGSAAVGEAHVQSDRFRAVNEALLPILADRIANLPSGKSDEQVWKTALDIGSRSGLSLSEAARLNRLVHVADPASDAGPDRGMVLALPEFLENGFQAAFDIKQKEAAESQFRCKDYEQNHDAFRWVLVQCQAACDHAQSQPGPTPCYLGLDFPESKKNRSRKPPASVWSSPPFEFDGTVRLLRVSARFPAALPSVLAQGVTRVYRLREQILNDLIYHVHGHGARPGMMSFRP